MELTRWDFSVGPMWNLNQDGSVLLFPGVNFSVGPMWNLYAILLGFTENFAGEGNEIGSSFLCTSSSAIISV